MSNRRFAATVALGLTGMLVLGSCDSDEENEPEPAYSGLTDFCNDLQYQALEDEFGVIEPWASQEDLDGILMTSQDPPSLQCGARSYYTADEVLTAHLNFSAFLEHGSYGLDLPEEAAPWLSPRVVYPGGNAVDPGTELTSVEQGLISKGESKQTGQTEFDSITYAAFQADQLGLSWDPKGAGEVIFAWYEDENLLIEFWLQVTDELYDASPDPEYLISILNETAEEIRQQLEYTPAGG
ncbi:hypothetical protein [Glycomyces arizonensis]|uniref:hypothetical protein n=1 Tax=Glycomyces arizonensis TaxID=256035 RepID=UPI0012EBFAE4|nr:hypothetical protein [Glycomyces arizonensis]